MKPFQPNIDWKASHDVEVIAVGSAVNHSQPITSSFLLRYVRLQHQ